MKRNPCEAQQEVQEKPVEAVLLEGQKKTAQHAWGGGGPTRGK